MWSKTELSVHLFATQWGPCAILLRGEHLVRIYTACGTQKQLMADIQERYASALPRIKPALLPHWAIELTGFLQQYYGGQSGQVVRNASRWPKMERYLDWSVVGEFDRRVLECTAGIQWGQTRTYGQLATAIGKPGAARAVGAALGRNPWPVLIPCHRVVGSNGKLTGFSGFGGVIAKKRMLAIEQSRAAG